MQSDNVLEIFLLPGDFFWGDSETRIRTILGSCVSICIWHPIKKFGGMCHFMLPDRRLAKIENSKLDGKYGVEAWIFFEREFEKSKTKPTEYIAKIFGGSEMFIKTEQNQNDIAMGVKNIEFAKNILAKNKIQIVSENIGGTRGRRIHFDLWSGNVWLKRQIEE